MLDTRNSELHSLEELRSQFGQFRESVLKELRPVSSPTNPHESGSTASSSHEMSAALPHAVLPPALEPTGSVPDTSRTNQNDTASNAWNSDEEIDGTHSSDAAHTSNTRIRTPLRRSPNSQAVAPSLSPAEASKQAHVIERERDALLSSGLYHENGEKCGDARIFHYVTQCLSDPLISALEAKILQLLADSQVGSSS